MFKCIPPCPSPIKGPRKLSTPEMDSEYMNSSPVTRMKQAKENRDQFILDVLGGGTAMMEEVKRFGVSETHNDAKH